MKMKILMLGILFLISCTVKEEGFFSNMPSTYEGDLYGGLFEGLSTIKILNGNGLKVNSEDCDLIPFCGVLEYRNDSIFYSNDQDRVAKLFLVLNSKEYSKIIIEYSDNRSDEVTYIGLSYDRKHQDSLALFKFKPIKRSVPHDTDYLKYLGIKRGGIRLLTFGSGNGKDVSIELTEKPTIILDRKSD